MPLFSRRRRSSELEKELGRLRPQPREEFLRELSAFVETRPGPARRSERWRIGTAIALSAGLLVVAAVFGGVSYAASSTAHAVQAVTQVVFHVRAHDVGSVSAAADQYHKVTLCHKGHTISVAEQAVTAHLAHGDMFGKCGKYARYKGTKRNDRIEGRKSHRNLEITDLKGNNLIRSGSGNDLIRTGGGNDVIYGDSGNDKIDSGAGNDKIHGGAGADVIFAGPGNDTIWVRDGRSDFVNCGPGQDTVYADAANVDYVAGNCEFVIRGGG